MQTAIRHFALFIVTACWAVLGFFFWIPFLLRAIALYTAIVVISMIRSRDISGASRELDRAIVFWIDGFKKIGAATQAQPPSSRTSFVSMADIGIMGLWTLACGLFWLGAWSLVFGWPLLMRAGVGTIARR